MARAGRADRRDPIGRARAGRRAARSSTQPRAPRTVTGHGKAHGEPGESGVGGVWRMVGGHREREGSDRECVVFLFDIATHQSQLINPHQTQTGQRPQSSDFYTVINTETYESQYGE